MTKNPDLNRHSLLTWAKDCIDEKNQHTPLRKLCHPQKQSQIGQFLTPDAVKLWDHAIKQLFVEHMWFTWNSAVNTLPLSMEEDWEPGMPYLWLVASSKCVLWLGILGVLTTKHDTKISDIISHTLPTTAKMTSNVYTPPNIMYWDQFHLLSLRSVMKTHLQPSGRG